MTKEECDQIVNDVIAPRWPSVLRHWTVRYMTEVIYPAVARYPAEVARRAAVQLARHYEGLSPPKAEDWQILCSNSMPRHVRREEGPPASDEAWSRFCREMLEVFSP